jgi:predicted nucleic acid-binding protein
LILYLDSSALVKLYTNEAHSRFMRGAAYAASVRVCHDIGYVECRAAFARKRREGSFGLSDQSRCRQQLERDWERFHIISVTPELIRRAAALAEDHGVRAYDSVHLAAAEAAYSMARGRTGFRFAAFDAKLIEAARRISLPMLSPD